MISKAKARQLRDLIVRASASLDDESALQGIELFPKWTATPPMTYEVGDRVRHEDTLYKCVQAHTSQDDWTPDKVPALFVEVSIEEFPEWKQPTGAHDAYNKGDKVSHNGKHWQSNVDGNVWEPPTMWDEI